MPERLILTVPRMQGWGIGALREGDLSPFGDELCGGHERLDWRVIMICTIAQQRQELKRRVGKMNIRGEG